MAEGGEQQWGLFSRVCVALFAAMVVGIAAKPYERKVMPMIEKVRSQTLSSVNFELPRRERTELPAIKPKPTGAKPARDKLTESDKLELERVLDKL